MSDEFFKPGDLVKHKETGDLGIVQYIDSNPDTGDIEIHLERADSSTKEPIGISTMWLYNDVLYVHPKAEIHPITEGGYPPNAPIVLGHTNSVPLLVPNTGTKHDTGKPPLSLINRDALEGEAQVMAFGAKKYGRDNYKAGMDWTRLVNAALRHIVAFADGEDDDTESGLSHLDHARCCLGMLKFYQTRKRGRDDRWKE